MRGGAEQTQEIGLDRGEGWGWTEVRVGLDRGEGGAR